MAEAKKKAAKTSTNNKSTNTKSDTRKSTTKKESKTEVKTNSTSKVKAPKNKKVVKPKDGKKKETLKKDNKVVEITEEKVKAKPDKNHKSNKPVRFVIYAIALVLVGFFCFSAYKIVSWQIDNNKTQTLIDELEKDTKIKETEGENPEYPNIFSLITSIDDDSIGLFSTKFIDVDFTDIKKENSDVVGWIQVTGTKVSYPFVQTKDNSYYLNHSFDKTVNEAGWIFLDYRNKLGQDQNTIIYGHGRLNKTMFGSLNDILENGWTDNPENFTIKISTETENTVWQIMSVYHIPNTNDYTHTNFATTEELVTFANKMMKRSMYDFKTSFNENDVMLTLSTCYSNSEKMVIHAKLIKKDVIVTEDTEEDKTNTETK